MRLRLILMLAAAVCSLCGLRAQEPEPVLRPVVSSYMAGIGAGHLADTYLSTQKYAGPAASLIYERLQAMRFDPERWVMRLQGAVQGDITENPAKNTDMYALGVQASWSMMRRFSVAPGLSLGAGPGTAIDLGVLYIDRGGNNPASAKAAWTIDASAFASYNCRLWRLPITLRYQGRLPVTGAFFAPDYGQLYYQIYIGDHKSLAHAAWWGNFFRLDNQLTADLHLGNTSLRLGYRCDIFSSKASGIVTRDITHLFVLGITTEWISLPVRSRRLPASAIISAY